MAVAAARSGTGLKVLVSVPGKLLQARHRLEFMQFHILKPGLVKPA
jgi:hypothetical protein